MATASSAGEDADDPSLADLAVLQDPNSTPDERACAFNRMLNRPRGWWGDGSLLRFAMAVAKLETRKRLFPYGLPIDLIDWESIANEALVVLFERAGKIQGSPKAWFWGVIKNLVRYEIRQSWELLTAERPEIMPEPEHSPREGRFLAFDDAVRRAIGELPDSYRVVLQLYFNERLTAKEIADVLRISYAAARQRFSRGMRLLRELLADLELPLEQEDEEEREEQDEGD